VFGIQKEYLSTTDIKYLDNASQVTIEDIPQEYRNELKIQTFMSAHNSNQEEKNALISKLEEEMFCIRCRAKICF
jgi:hypothetical protein